MMASHNICHFVSCTFLMWPCALAHTKNTLIEIWWRLFDHIWVNSMSVEPTWEDMCYVTSHTVLLEVRRTVAVMGCTWSATILGEAVAFKMMIQLRGPIYSKKIFPSPLKCHQQSAPLKQCSMDSCCLLQTPTPPSSDIELHQTS